ncbi:MAG: PKD domain-containing protein, partial [Bacteroidota bacterium]
PLLAYFRALPQHNNNRKPARICWTFGDGRDTCINYPENYTGQYVVSHLYNHPGQYEVCVRILYYGGCEARKCDQVVVINPDICHANFERIPSGGNNPLLAYFRALPQHNNNRKPARICWTFGDGKDTCINYPENYTGQYVVSHLYNHPGQYEVCINILYHGGCEARKCDQIVILPPQVNCSVHLFELTSSITSLVRSFLAVPSSTPPSRPERICWHFGDGQDTCIMIDPQHPLPDFIIRHTYPAPGVYRACVSIRFQNGCNAEECKEVVIRPSTNICGGYMTDSLVAPRTFKFKGFSIHNPTDEATGYHWTFGDGSTGAGREVTHTYNNAGEYRVCLVINTRSGCETRICNTVRVFGNNEPSLHLSPNPVTTVLHAAFLSTHTEQVSIKIQNGNGIVVRNYIRNVTVGPNSLDFDLSSLVPGLYSFILQSPNQLASAIFIKQ